MSDERLEWLSTPAGRLRAVEFLECQRTTVGRFSKSKIAQEAGISVGEYEALVNEPARANPTQIKLLLDTHNRLCYDRDVKRARDHLKQPTGPKRMSDAIRQLISMCRLTREKAAEIAKISKNDVDKVLDFPRSARRKAFIALFMALTEYHMTDEAKKIYGVPNN